MPGLAASTIGCRSRPARRIPSPRETAATSRIPAASATPSIFGCRPGTPVVAARDGTVVLVRDDRPDGTGRVGDENIVMIEHADGRDLALHTPPAGRRPGGEGRSRGRRRHVALSGNSGRSAFPHLHFDVATDCGRGGCHTVPSAFLNADPPVPGGRRLGDGAGRPSAAPVSDGLAFRGTPAVAAVPGARLAPRRVVLRTGGLRGAPPRAGRRPGSARPGGRSPRSRS